MDAPVTPLGARTPHAHPALPRIIAGLAALVLVGAYLAWADITGRWPYAPSSEPVPTFTASPSPAGLEYRNDDFGFSIALPASWSGYTVEQGHWQGQVYDGAGAQTGTDEGPLVVVRFPGDGEAAPHEDMPVMVLTADQWVLAGDAPAQGEAFMSVSAAPVPPAFLASNSRYVLALPARYNYDFQPGWEEVDRIVHGLRAFEPTPEQESL